MTAWTTVVAACSSNNIETDRRNAKCQGADISHAVGEPERERERETEGKTRWRHRRTKTICHLLSCERSDGLNRVLGFSVFISYSIASAMLASVRCVFSAIRNNFPTVKIPRQIDGCYVRLIRVNCEYSWVDLSISMQCTHESAIPKIFSIELLLKWEDCPQKRSEINELCKPHIRK